MSKTGYFRMPHVVGLKATLVAITGLVIAQPAVAAVVVPDITRDEHVSTQPSAPWWPGVLWELSEVRLPVGRGEVRQSSPGLTTPASRTANLGRPIRPSARESRPTLPGRIPVVAHGYHDLYGLPVPPTAWQPQSSAGLRYPSTDFGGVPRSPQPFQQQTPVIRKPFSWYQTPSDFSPYLHLYREDTVEGIDNYNLLVKPLLDQQESGRRSGDDNE